MAWYDPSTWFTSDGPPLEGENPVGGGNPTTNSYAPTFIDALTGNIDTSRMTPEDRDDTINMTHAMGGDAVPDTISAVETGATVVAETAKKAYKAVGSWFSSFLWLALIIGIVGLFAFFFIRQKASNLAR